MRRLEFTTLVDPFEARFGKRWAAVLFVPAMCAEVFWSAELLVAVGSTFGVVLGMPFTQAVLLSAAVVTAYTVVGGMWSVAYTDVVQLGMVALGMVFALAFMAGELGGLTASGRATRRHVLGRPASSRQCRLPAPRWTMARIVGWWDVSLMLMLGGVPWNCYFQRVLACQTPARAQWHSLLAGALTIAFTVPPLLLGCRRLPSVATIMPSLSMRIQRR